MYQNILYYCVFSVYIFFSCFSCKNMIYFFCILLIILKEQKGATMKRESFTDTLKQPKVLAGAAMLIAVNVVLYYFNIMIGDTLRIGVSFLPIAVCGMLYGPVIGGIAGALGDVIGFIVKPMGYYFPGFTISAFLVGFLFGILLHNKVITLARVAGSVLLYTILISLILSPIWLNIMYGSSLFAIPRIYKAILQYPINVVMVYTVTKCISRYHFIINLRY